MKKLDYDSDYVEAKLKLESLKKQLKEAHQQYKEKVNIISDIARQPVTDRLTLEAQSILDGGDLNQVSDEMRKAQESATQVCHKISVLTKAIQMQERVVENIRYMLSDDIAKEKKPQHIKNVKGVCDAIGALDAAMKKERELRESLFEGDIAYISHIRPMVLQGVGSLSDPYSPLSMYLLEAEEHGFIQKSDLPENLQEHVKSKQAVAKTAVKQEVIK